MFTMPMPISPNYRILCSNSSGDKTPTQKRYTVMTYINEEEEKEIDGLGNKFIKLERGDIVFSINHNKIYCYGEINLYDKETINEINKFRFLDFLSGFSGIPIYSNYNYDNHCCYSPRKYLLKTETWTPIDLVKYAHGCLNKPNRIILFDYVPNTIQKKRSR